VKRSGNELGNDASTLQPAQEPFIAVDRAVKSTAIHGQNEQPLPKNLMGDSFTTPKSHILRRKAINRHMCMWYGFLFERVSAILAIISRS